MYFQCKHSYTGTKIKQHILSQRGDCFYYSKKLLVSKPHWIVICINKWEQWMFLKVNSASYIIAE